MVGSLKEAVAVETPARSRGLIPGVEQSSGENPVQAWKVTDRRRTVGYVLGAVTGVTVLGVVITSLVWLDRLPMPENPAFHWLYLAKLAGHAAVTLAGVFFCFQLLNVAERMVLPHWWLQQHPTTVRLMLGIDEPARAGTRLLRGVLHEVRGLVGDVLNKK